MGTAGYGGGEVEVRTGHEDEVAWRGRCCSRRGRTAEVEVEVEVEDFYTEGRGGWWVVGEG